MTVARVLRQYTASYVAQHRQQAVPQVQSTLAKLSLCRTAAMGGRRYRCGSCESECTVASIEPPPSDNALPEHVVKSLARYLTGGPISDPAARKASERSPLRTAAVLPLVRSRFVSSLEPPAQRHQAQSSSSRPRDSLQIVSRS